MPMHEEDNGWLAFYRNLTIWLIGALLTVGGLAVGIWSSNVETQLNQLDATNKKQWERIAENASLGERTKALERYHETIEERLRTVEMKMGAIKH